MNCGVNILDQTDVCPLCHCVVEADEGEVAGESYPDIRMQGKKLELLGRICLFVSIAIGVLAVTLNISYWADIWWSVIVVGGLAYLQLIMFFMIENQHAGYRSKIILGVACGEAYVILIDYVFGFTRWSLNYAIPGAILAIDIMIIVAMFVNLRNWQSYLLFQILMILCSGVCMVLCFAGVITEPMMSYIVFGSSCMMFLATFIIGGNRASNELKRRFHVM